jgi:hypothetical protein
MAQQAFGHLAARGVASTEEENTSRHSCDSN